MGSTSFPVVCYFQLPKAGLNSLQSQLQSPIYPWREGAIGLNKRRSPPSILFPDTTLAPLAILTSCCNVESARSHVRRALYCIVGFHAFAYLSSLHAEKGRGSLIEAGLVFTPPFMFKVIKNVSSL